MLLSHSINILITYLHTFKEHSLIINCVKTFNSKLDHLTLLMSFINYVVNISGGNRERKETRLIRDLFHFSCLSIFYLIF